MAVRKIEHVGIMTSDLERSIAFYAQVVGLVHTDTVPHTNGVIRLAFLSFPSASETELELIEGYDGTLAPEGACTTSPLTSMTSKPSIRESRCSMLRGSTPRSRRCRTGAVTSFSADRTASR